MIVAAAPETLALAKRYAAGTLIAIDVNSWLLTGYLLSASIFTPIMGRLGDAYGKQRLLVISLAALALVAAGVSAQPPAPPKPIASVPIC